MAPTTIELYAQGHTACWRTVGRELLSDSRANTQYVLSCQEVAVKTWEWCDAIA